MIITQLILFWNYKEWRGNLWIMRKRALLAKKIEKVFSLSVYDRVIVIDWIIYHSFPEIPNDITPELAGVIRLESENIEGKNIND